ncbi:MAG: threonine/serine dehydratase [Candidatus Nanohalobium sp.]
MTQHQSYATTQHNNVKPGKSFENSDSDIKEEMNDEIISMQDIMEARERIEDAAHYTPVDESSTFAEKSGAEKVCFKLENFQRTGAFKIRGAYNKIAQLSEDRKEKGVIAASSGNHAQGVAMAAQELGVDATIVMPEGTPEAKKEATAGYGAEVVLEGEDYEESYLYARKLEEEKDLTFVHPYNDRDVMAGQGTLGLEIVEQFPEVDTVLVAVGGGGLISGVARPVKAYNPDAKVVGVQTEGCGSAKETLESGEVYERDSVDTVAGGIATRKVGELSKKHMLELVDEVVYVSDEQVKAAQALLAERQKVVVEPAGAVAAAACLFNQELEDLDLSGENVAVPLCGGNTDLEKFSEHVKTGKEVLEEVM